jgi:hypothetical protein
MDHDDRGAASFDFDVGLDDVGVDQLTAIARRCGPNLPVNGEGVGYQGDDNRHDDSGKDSPTPGPWPP